MKLYRQNCVFKVCPQIVTIIRMHSETRYIESTERANDSQETILKYNEIKPQLFGKTNFSGWSKLILLLWKVLSSAREEETRFSSCCGVFCENC